MTSLEQESRIYFCTSDDLDWDPIEAHSPQDAAEKYVLDMQVDGCFVEEETLVTVNVGSTCAGETKQFLVKFSISSEEV